MISTCNKSNLDTERTPQSFTDQGKKKKAVLRIIVTGRDAGFGIQLNTVYHWGVQSMADYFLGIVPSPLNSGKAREKWL